jgi:glucans biosynthesis protein C
MVQLQGTSAHTTATSPPPILPDRAAELDWLRLAAVVCVLVVHSAQIFSPFESWHIASPDRSELLGLMTAFAAPWIMPLFMLLAGGGAWYSLQRRTPGGWVRARVPRLLVPLVLGTLILIPPQVYYRRVFRGEFTGSYLEFYPHFFRGVFPEGNFSYGHLWFLAYLLVYVVAAKPVFQLLGSPRGAALLARVAGWCSGRWGVLLLALPFVAGQLLLRWRWPQSTGTLVNDWATHAWLFTALVAGYALLAEPRLMAAVDRGWRAALGPAVGCWVVLALYVAYGDPYMRLPAQPGFWYFVFYTTFALASWSWMVVILGLARRHLSRSTPFLERWRGWAYGIYVVHQTVVVMVAFHVVRLPLELHVRFLLIVALSLAGTLLAIALLRRVPGAGRALGVG